MGTISPLLTASLGAELDLFTDQLTLTGATGANGPNGETCCQELCFGGGGEVHCGLVAVCSIQGQGSGVKPCQLGGAVSIDACLCHCLPHVVGTMGVQLGATLNHVGGDPYGLAGLEIGCLIEQCHGWVRLVCG